MPAQELQLLDLPDELLVEVLSQLDQVERCGCALGCTSHLLCGAAAMPHVAQFLSTRVIRYTALAQFDSMSQ